MSNNLYNEYWDEDSFPPDIHEKGDIEYWEDYEEEDENYPHQYSAIQGNWDFEDLDSGDNFQKIGRQRVRKVQSVKTYDAIRAKERQNQKKKIRSEVKKREKQRQKYYHYGENEDEE